jgi:hypothetical protein
MTIPRMSLAADQIYPVGRCACIRMQNRVPEGDFLLDNGASAVAQTSYQQR